MAFTSALLPSCLTWSSSGWATTDGCFEASLSGFGTGADAVEGSTVGGVPCGALGFGWVGVVPGVGVPIGPVPVGSPGFVVGGGCCAAAPGAMVNADRTSVPTRRQYFMTHSPLPRTWAHQKLYARLERHLPEKSTGLDARNPGRVTR